jgi:hypothetical protein
VSVGSAASIKHRILCVDDEIIGTRIRGEIPKKHGYSRRMGQMDKETIERNIDEMSN